MIPICVSKHKIHRLCKYRGLRYLELVFICAFFPTFIRLYGLCL
uniref:Uncharacterized protein n=1 Tax=Anguilla anguilla TaxID=7936 RepID=A0A0E9SC57_ANGAN